MKKRIIRALSLLLSLLVATGSFVVRIHADDTTPSEAYASAVQLARKDVITLQANESDYRLSDGMTRAEMAKTLFGFYNEWNSENITFSCSGEMFTDIPVGHPFCNYIEPLAAKGIFTSGSGVAFRPDDTITRAEMAVILVRFLGESGSTDLYAFRDVGPEFAALAPYISRAVDLGIVRKQPYFRPNDPVSRGEAFIMIARVWSRTTVTQ